MKVAIIHDWLVTFAGAEKVLAEIIEVFPQADLFSLVDFLPDKDREKLKGKKAFTSIIQKLPYAKKKYRNYLMLMPFAIEQFDLSKYDLIISSSHAVAKGVITGPDQLHISYVHSPIRYAWDLQHQYLKESKLDRGIKSLLVKKMLKKIRDWDYRTANGVDEFISNSNFIGRRIWKVYRRESTTIYPPVDVSSFILEETKKEDFYLTASRLVPYKKIDLIVEAFSNMPEKKLMVIGDGPDMKKIKQKANSNVEVLGYQEFEVLKSSMQKAKAFVFAAEEDFGITPVEAQACGTPVIAYGKGGALETVRNIDKDSPTGILFEKQTVNSVIDAVNRFEKNQQLFTSANCRENAMRFSPENFRNDLKNHIYKTYNKREGELSK
ncbi:glycosyltransferase family 4 protein [Terribacillus saccharophilus]|uniref:Glycosyl transferase family 1 n=1 Tax=Terribacillus saccharophilus TaxID=361277 RepID=A0A268AEV4_9BACI|nr:glycosyltransferase family 4 protein [Terribacillus saccharophilus]PAD22645.1 glycosyl transferase family 1 [Terribacillus saccharophilus]